MIAGTSVRSFSDTTARAARSFVRAIPRRAVPGDDPAHMKRTLAIVLAAAAAGGIAGALIGLGLGDGSSSSTTVRSAPVSSLHAVADKGESAATPAILGGVVLMVVIPIAAGV